MNDSGDGISGSDRAVSVNIPSPVISVGIQRVRFPPYTDVSLRFRNIRLTLYYIRITV